MTKQELQIKLKQDANAVIGESFKMVVAAILEGKVDDAEQFTKDHVGVVAEQIDLVAGTNESPEEMTQLKEQLETLQAQVKEKEDEVTQLTTGLEAEKETAQTTQTRVTQLETANKELSEKLNLKPLEPNPTPEEKQFTNWRDYDKHLDAKVAE